MILLTAFNLSGLMTRSLLETDNEDDLGDEQWWTTPPALLTVSDPISIPAFPAPSASSGGGKRRSKSRPILLESSSNDDNVLEGTKIRERRRNRVRN